MAINDIPYISFVVVARNDNYGGDFIYRMNIFIKILVMLCEKYHLHSELIIVEWNPPSNRPKLKDAVTWLDIQRKYINIKIIEIPGAIHNKLPNPSKMHLFEYLGKNVGIRRARGEYILTTNPDIMFSEELIRFLAHRRLRHNHYYRIDRHDVRTPVPADATIDSILKYCRENVIKIYGYYWSTYVPGVGDKYWYLKKVKSVARFIKAWINNYPIIPPHTSASGDFLLMHRVQWNSIHGFPEFEFKGKSHHIDSLMLLVVNRSGLKQTILRNPLKLFHQDHGRLESDKPISTIVQNMADEIRGNRKVKKINSPNISWGLFSEHLPEISL